MIKAVIFDWAGTTVDYGCFAPVQAFMETFKAAGVEPTMEETRKPMGMLKIDHIRTMQNPVYESDVFRIAHVLKFAGPSADTPAKTEQALLKLYPKEYWKPINHQWVLFGREFCIARRPRCSACFLSDLCPNAPKENL